MPASLSDVKALLNTVLQDILLKFEDLEKLMFFINSLNDLGKNKFAIHTVVELKKALLNLPLQAEYRLPKTIQQPINPPKEVQALFDFFKQMHYSLWEVKSKIRILKHNASALDSMEKAVQMLKLSKSLKDIIEPTSQTIRQQLAGATIPDAIVTVSSVQPSEDTSQWEQLKKRQEQILLVLQKLETRLNSLL